MFIDFFYLLRGRGLPVSPTEWLVLCEALAKGHGGESLQGFYHLCRSLCVKTEAHFDIYDQCFASYFEGVEADQKVVDQIMEWLKNPIFPRTLSDEELAQLKALDMDELRRQFEERMREQKERHDGGNRWVGTGGTSPFGQGGTNPAGVRVGDQGGGRSAVQVATDRRFRNLRNDVTLDVRQISVALHQLRRLSREGVPDELDIDGTIDATARNAGDLEILFRPERRNNVKLMLLMDVGGSMTPYSQQTERLFSAAFAAKHFKEFRHYYFHNTPYGTLFTDIARREGRPTQEVLAEVTKKWCCIIVGDAAMHPYELTMPGGAIDYFTHNTEPGLRWLNRVAEAMPRSAWLNPEPVRYWDMPSTRIIREVFDMFPLTIDGLSRAVTSLRTKSASITGAR